LPDLAGVVARTLDQHGIASTVPASVLNPFKPGMTVVGPALTIRNIPTREVPYRRWSKRQRSGMGEREAFFLARPGDVVVIDGLAAYPASCLGSMAVSLASSLGVAGVVVGGAVTGVAGIKAATIPTWAMGGTTITGHHRLETVEVNGAIGLCGIRVESGDLVVADDSGVTIVPQVLIKSVLGRASRMRRLGEPLRSLMRSGADRQALRDELARWSRKYARLGRGRL
jgi:4-hydroxy-4-methyl-2-oxoglutarate aldolase